MTHSGNRHARGKPLIGAVPKERSLSFICTTEMHAAVQDAARRDGETVAVWLRRTVRKALAGDVEPSTTVVNIAPAQVAPRRGGILRAATPAPWQRLDPEREAAIVRDDAHGARTARGPCARCARPGRGSFELGAGAFCLSCSYVLEDCAPMNYRAEPYWHVCRCGMHHNVKECPKCGQKVRGKR